MPKTIISDDLNIFDVMAIKEALCKRHHTDYNAAFSYTPSGTKIIFSEA